MTNDSAKVILRLKKTIIYTLKILDNYPKKDYLLRDKISNNLFTILEDTYFLYSLKDKEKEITILKKILSKMKLLDFYLKISLDKNLISRKKISNLCINLRDITNMYYKWITFIEKKI